MKVFNWVHRRLLHVHSGGNSFQGTDEKGMERNGKSKVDVETHALLGHEGHLMMDMINDWKEGILAIGTLAIGPLEATITAKCELLKKHADVDDDEDDDDDCGDDDDAHQDDETNNYGHVIDEYYDEDDEGIESSPLMKMTLFSHELEKMDVDEGNDMDVFTACNEIKAEEIERQVKRRVTLADLFLEESVKETKGSSAYVTHDDDTHYFSSEKSNLKLKSSSISSPKKGLSKAKKLLKEELRPIKKFNQLMKRMMKKKVHPDMVEAGSEKDIEMQPRKATNESASLLLLRDSEV